MQHLVDDGCVAGDRVKYYAHDIASALHYIHSMDIVHLDVKPSNVFVTSYDLAKLGGSLQDMT